MTAAPTNSDSQRHLLKQVRSHEVAIAELNNLPASRVSLIYEDVLVTSSPDGLPEKWKHIIPYNCAESNSIRTKTIGHAQI
uniref:Uncharacterized protein LOC104230944 isoform X1 n=1 Tax=Nicotiana sylvestris TaxID=4096 RepID=A0A1U7WU87_NICSY|nr:PREDICTED: uncharacterized protein LOC104230944 isoform X1 [Nicotiana sylvestris]